MRLNSALLIVILIASLCFCNTANWAQSSSPAWAHSIDGISFELDSYGEVLRIFSKVSQSVSIPDRRGIRNAQLIAEERAKAAIVRFIEETIEDVTIVESIEGELQATFGTRRGLDGETEFTTEVARVASESIMRVTRSHSDGELRGVVRLEQGYDPENEEAWVMVGISRETTRTSDAARRFLGN